MIQVRPSPPPPPPPMVGSPSNLKPAVLHSSAPPPPLLWCGVVRLCPRCLARFPSPLWGGVVWLCLRPGPYCSSSDISGIIIIIIIFFFFLRGKVCPYPACAYNVCCDTSADGTRLGTNALWAGLNAKVSRILCTSSL